MAETMAVEQESDEVGFGAGGVADEAALVMARLGEAERAVARMGPSGAERRLKQMLAVFRRVVASWDASSPSARQIAFLNRLIEDVLREATAE